MASTPQTVRLHSAPADEIASTHGRLTLRMGEVATALGISRRLIERERAAGRFPAPDLIIGRTPLWRPETIRAWIDRKGVA